METKKKYRIMELDPDLRPFEADIDLRVSRYNNIVEGLTQGRKSLSDYADGHLYYGFHETQTGWVYREWAPNADSINLSGDFNDWNFGSHPLTSLEGGNWEIQIDGAIPHGSRVKLRIHASGRDFERLPLYCRRVVQAADTRAFDGVIWRPPVPYEWRNSGFTRKQPLYIFECHIGMSGEHEGIASFADFTEATLPRIKKLGYTAIQIMAVMEHPYYGSFGYQVSNFFAVSSRFGTPDDFKALVDAAHGMGIAVIMDIVHSHTVKNTAEGLSEFDGTDYQFCHHGIKGTHSAWNTRLFNYGKWEVLRFLLSNIRYWLEEYHLDGFRFDGVTSMLYHHHGLGVAFTDYSQYFSMNTDTDAVTYLQLASAVAKEINPSAILIAEDMSGMPGMCLPTEDGGVGFDYRLNMGLPDYLIRTMKGRDEDWRLGVLWHEMISRRPQEKVISYTESHDQALVGDKTMMFWLADKDMYWHMRKGDANERINRALALHKMLRLITCATAGDGYLNFMGNEFGHPEWIDFPREGNGWSYYYARRQWSLVDDPDLKYSYLRDFDAAMLAFLAKDNLFAAPSNFESVHEDNKTLVFKKGGCTFLFNFHPQKSSTQKIAKGQRIVFHSNWQRFGGSVDEGRNDGLLYADNVVVDRRSAVVVM